MKCSQESNTPYGDAYRKRPVVISAKQWFKDGDHPEVKPHGHGQYDPLSMVTCGSCKQEMFWKSSMGGGVGVMHFTHGEVKTLESAAGSAHIVCPGDWIIQGVKGEFYACKPDIFAATYELATVTPSESTTIIGRAVCPDCYRFKARNADDCAAGDCSKWWAIRDKEADKDCQDFRNKTGYWERNSATPSAVATMLLDENDEPLRELCFNYRNCHTTEAEAEFQKIVQFMSNACHNTAKVRS